MESPKIKKVKLFTLSRCVFGKNWYKRNPRGFVIYADASREKVCEFMAKDYKDMLEMYPEMCDSSENFLGQDTGIAVAGDVTNRGIEWVVQETVATAIEVDKHLERVRWAVVRTTYGTSWMDQRPASDVVFVEENRQRAWQLLKNDFDDHLTRYPKILKNGEKHVNETTGLAYAGDERTIGLKYCLQMIMVPLTKKDIEDAKDYWNRNFTAFKDTREEEDF